MKLGITMGDINGIGPEVIIKALSNPMILKGITPVIYGSSKVLSYYKNILPELNFAYQQVPSPDKAQHSKINVINCWEEMVNITPGKATAEGGSYAFKALERATSDLKEKQLDCLVTAPINKEAMKMANFQYPGHTEYIESVIGGQSIMMMVSEDLKVGLVTNHLPIKDVTKSITKELIIQKINLLNQTLITDFDKEKPVIAVLGLNPHAGDNGAIGDDEDKIIRPAILELKKKGLLVHGPYSADGFFGSGSFKKVDAILAMYHDQGLIPFKAISFGSGVNFTAGLPVVRTSPDHGTGYDIAGQGNADADSMLSAIFTAKNVFRNRFQYADDRKNRLQKRAKTQYNEDDDEIIDEA